jgi:two-component system, chemotaxis family, sensor kinase CheA
VTARDAGLTLLLAAEIEKRLALFSSDVTPEAELRLAVHSLRGSAAMAGESDLAIVLAQLGTRLKAGDPGVRSEALALLQSARARLTDSESAFAEQWPSPPPGLSASPIDPRHKQEYLAAMRDRLAELDQLDYGRDGARAVLESAYRSVHGMKSAAGSVGDDLTAWYCHGLEARLKAALQSGAGVEDSARDLPRHRAMLGLFIEEPSQALETLRALSGAGPVSSPPSRPPPAGDDDEAVEAPLRVPGAAIERLLERLERIELAHEELSGTADAARQLALRLREVRSGLVEALRAIGPPRPWGAPAAALTRIEGAARTLTAAADNADYGSASCRRTAEALHSRAGEMRAELAALRRTTLGWLFGKIASGTERLAQREGRVVRVEIESSDLPLDRGLAERLLDPLMQLVQNAVAHGIQPPDVRVQSGKAPIGTITLRAARLGDWLRIVVEDDGRGVDVGQIRRLAMARGALSAEAADQANEDELLALLFLPGLTTREDADLLAGRGVGLDLARDAVRRLGGAIRLASRAGTGLTATIEVPSERGIVEVLWLEAAGLELALPVSFTGRLGRPSPDRRPVHLARCLGLEPTRAAELALELVIVGVQPIPIGIDAVGAVEEASVRALPRLVAAAGPYAGAILRGDGSLRLALDPALLAARAWASIS